MKTSLCLRLEYSISDYQQLQYQLVSCECIVWFFKSLHNKNLVVILVPTSTVNSYRCTSHRDFTVAVQRCCRRKQDEVEVLEETIRQRSEQQKKAGVELDATCHICLKTKFADGVGHMCNYCNIRCCARCGGKVTLRSNKVHTSTFAGLQL